MDIKTTPTVDLVHILCTTDSKNQYLINMIAYELACRIYIPNNSQGITFEQLLNDFGYLKEVEKENNKVY